SIKRGERTIRRAMAKSVGAAGLERIEIKRLTERLGKLYSVLHEAARTATAPLARAFNPPGDACETANPTCIRIELPGVKANEIKIGLNSYKIKICGEKKKRPSRQRVISHLCSERNYGQFSRVVPLRWTISIKDTRAQLRDGILMIHLPKISDRRGSEYRVPIQEIE